MEVGGAKAEWQSATSTSFSSQHITFFSTDRQNKRHKLLLIICARWFIILKWWQLSWTLFKLRYAHYDYTWFWFPPFFLDVTQFDNHKYSNILTEIGTVGSMFRSEAFVSEGFFFSLSLCWPCSGYCLCNCDKRCPHPTKIPLHPRHSKPPPHSRSILGMLVLLLTQGIAGYS